MKNLKCRVKRLQEKTGTSDRKMHLIMIEPDQDPEEVKRRYYEENDVKPNSTVLIVNFSAHRGEEDVKDPERSNQPA